MVATRRGAKKAPEVDAAPTNTLNAPPKRGRKAAVKEATEPAPAPAKSTKTTAPKRKAKAEPEDAEQPMAKKTVATRAACPVKVAAKAASAPAAPKRATRGRKVEQPAVIEESEDIEEAPKPAATRTRKIPAVKKAPASKAAPKTAPEEEEPVIVEQPATEEAPKPATRTRNAPTKKTTVAKKVELPVVEDTIAAEPAKPAPRTRKAAVPKAAVPVIAPRATRGRKAPAVSQDSPLKAPARKLTKKAAPVAKAEPVEEPFAEFPGYPTTPAHIIAPINVKVALAELPGYPSTPAHIVAPTAPAHEYKDVEMMDVEDDTAAEHEEVVMPEEAELLPAPAMDGASGLGTPTQATMAVLQKSPAQPATPTQAITPYETTPVVEPMEDMEEFPSHIVWGMTNREAFEELPAGYPSTPAPVTPPHLALEAAIQEEITASVKKQTPSPEHFARFAGAPEELAETSEITEITEISEVTFAGIAEEAPSTAVVPSIQLAPLKLAPSLAAPEPASPKKSALRSPQKMEAKTPKKAVTWTDHQVEDSCVSLYDSHVRERFLKGMVFVVDVTRNGKEQNFLFESLLEELGAKVAKDISSTAITHVLFKDGDMSTLEKCYHSKGAIKCVNVGWVIDSDEKNERMDEEKYLVDVSVAKPATPLPPVAAKSFTPFKTPSKYKLPPSSECKLPSTPTSSEFDRSFNKENENCDVGAFFDSPSPLAPRTVPYKKSSFLFGRSPMKTPSRPNFLTTTPAKHSLFAIKPVPQAVTTAKKRSADTSFFNSSLGPPKKLRLF